MENNELKVYFNQMEYNLYFTGNTNEKLTVKIFNVNGLVALTNEIKGNSTLSLTDLDSGVYFVHVYGGENNVTSKIIVY